jgi:hypothetical protein
MYYGSGWQHLLYGGRRHNPVAATVKPYWWSPVDRGDAKDISLHNNLGFAPGTYRGVIADASPANSNNNVRIDRHSAVIHLEAISSIVLPN